MSSVSPPASPRVALYARVSSEDQIERESIQNQIEAANAICPALGMTIVGTYLDDGVPGTIPIEQRPAGARILADAKAGQFEQVVVYRLDRIGRTGMIILSAHDALKRCGVAFRSLTEPFDTSNPFGEFVMGILAMVAAYERDSIVQRSSLGRRRKAREGYWTGGRAPLGYRVLDQKLVIDEEEAEIVRQIFRWYNEERLSAYAIAERLNALGVATQSTRRGITSKRIKLVDHWDHTRVLMMLKNPTYMGERRIGRQSKSKQTITQEVPAILDRATWDRAQELRPLNWKMSSRNAKRLYLLRGLIDCGICGRRYSGLTQTNQNHIAYYRCGQYRCPNPDVRVELVEDVVWSDIRDWIDRPGDLVAKLMTQVNDLTGAEGEAELDALSRALQRVEAERSRVISLIRKGLISEAEGEAQLIASARERDDLAGRKLVLENARAQREEEKARIRGVAELLAALQGKADKATPETKRMLMELLVEKVIVEPSRRGEYHLNPRYRFRRPAGESSTGIADTSYYRNDCNHIDSFRLSTQYRLLSLPELARQTGIGYGRLWRRVTEGRLKAIRVGEYWYVRQDITSVQPTA